MSLKSAFAEKRSMYELIPIIQNWLIENGYHVSIIANRIDAKKEEVTVKLFFENYPSGCLIKVVSDEQFFSNLKAFLASRHLLNYFISCSYCGRKFEASRNSCPFCGAPKK
jgi:hypothetical protein